MVPKVMKAVVYLEPGVLELRSVPVPVPGPEDILVNGKRIEEITPVNFFESWIDLAQAQEAAIELATNRFSRDKLADQLESVLLCVAGKAEA